MKVYPYGYATHEVGIAHLMHNHPELVMIDTRLKPWSHKPAWRAAFLKATYGDRYRWAGQYLGNVNYKNGGPICLADRETGLRGLRHWLQRGFDLLLLCGCAEYTRCHLKTIVDALQTAWPEVETVLPASGASEERSMCLSIRQPWTWLLTHPEIVASCGMEPKTLENRAWSTHYRGPLLLHAGATIEATFFDRHSGLLLSDYWTWKFGGAGVRLAQAMPQRRGEYATGAIVGIADLVDVVDESDSPWFVGDYGLVLANARAITPMVYPGSRRLFEVPDIPVLDLHQEVVR